MAKAKITKEDLYKFSIGQQKVFTMVTKGQARSGQSLANQMRTWTEGRMEFSTRMGTPSPSNGETMIIITRIK